MLGDNKIGFDGRGYTQFGCSRRETVQTKTRFGDIRIVVYCLTIGYVGVVNRSQKDLLNNKSINEAIEAEKVRISLQFLARIIIIDVLQKSQSIREIFREDGNSSLDERSEYSLSPASKADITYHKRQPNSNHSSKK